MSRDLEDGRGKLGESRKSGKSRGIYVVEIWCFLSFSLSLPAVIMLYQLYCLESLETRISRNQFKDDREINCVIFLCISRRLATLLILFVFISMSKVCPEKSGIIRKMCSVGELATLKGRGCRLAQKAGFWG